MVEYLNTEGRYEFLMIGYLRLLVDIGRRPLRHHEMLFVQGADRGEQLVCPGMRGHGHVEHWLGHGLRQDDRLARVQLLRRLHLVGLSMNGGKGVSVDIGFQKDTARGGI